MRTRFAFVVAAVALAISTAALGVDTTIPAKVGLVKPAKLAKFVSKPTSGTFPLPSGPTDPSAVGAQISVFDTSPSGGGSFTHALPAGGWTALGNPAGSKGFKYKGKAVGDTTCSIVLIKPTVIKGVCKGTSVTLTTPFAGDDGIIISIPAVSPQARYCADLGGTTKKNTSTGLKRTDAPAPGSCPSVASTPTVTNTPTTANTPTRTATRTATNTPVNTATATNTVNTPTRTNTPAATATRTATPTFTVACPIAAAGRYTETTTGGVLKVSTFQPFAFPSGGMTIQDVSAPDANCVHNTVIPYPGGFSTPVFCVPALGYTVQVKQTGCGVGIIDSNGGSDLTTTEKGDTSFTSGSCTANQACPGFVDSSGEIDITVGDGTTDTCSSGGTGNAMVSIPVFTTTWLSSNGCPDPDMDPNGGDDTIITTFPQTLDLTTDRATAQFADNDANGCSLQGAGPAGPYTTNQICFAAGNPYACCTGAGTGTCVGNGGVGKCIDFVGNTVNVAGGGTVFSDAAPLHDLLFTTVQNSNISAPAAFGGATCGSPPVINFAGVAHRCIIAP